MSANEVRQADVRPGAIRRVVIVGGGTAGWMSAALLSRLYGSRLQLTLVESEDIGSIGVGEATIPAIKLYNRLVGLEENAFLQATKGTFKLGIEFVNWSSPQSRYIHGFGRIGQEFGWLRTHQYWLKMNALGRAGDLGDYSINTAAAAENRFSPARPDLPESPLRDIAFAYHFDASLYAQYLRSQAEGRGVVRHEGRINGFTLDSLSGHVQSVRLEDGREISGELFIDCSGLRGLLIEDALKTGYEDWSHWLACDRAVAAPCASVSPLTPYTRSTARESGWQWRIPLQHRIGNGIVYSSQFMSDDEAHAQLVSHLDGELLAEPRLIRFATGKRKKIWNRNVVAIGLSSGFLEPLESTSIHLIQSNLLRLVALFPDLSFRRADIDLFNAQADFEYECTRDFIIAHYKLTARDDTPFWRRNRDMDIPESLQRKLELFASAGRVFRENDELFAEESWIQVLLGQGLVPAGYDPGVDIKSEAEITNYLNNIRQVIRRCVATMPGHAEYIAANCSAANA